MVVSPQEKIHSVDIVLLKYVMLVFNLSPVFYMTAYTIIIVPAVMRQMRYRASKSVQLFCFDTCFKRLNVNNLHPT